MPRATQKPATQFAHVHNVCTEPLKNITVGMMLREAAVEHRNREALVSSHQGERYTYHELWTEVERIARALIAVGVTSGERVGILSGNRSEWVVTHYAAALVGAVLVCISPAFRMNELRHVLRKSALSVLIMAESFVDTDFVSLLTKIDPSLDVSAFSRPRSTEFPELRRIVLLDSTGEGGWPEFKELCDLVDPEMVERRAVEVDCRDVASIVHTSGTTGEPKGAMLSHQSILNTGFFAGRRLKYTVEDRICLPVQLAHSFGSAVGMLGAHTHGALLVMPSTVFEPAGCFRAIQEERCTILNGVPTMFIALAERARRSPRPISTLRSGIMTGAPCPRDLMVDAMTVMHIQSLTTSYGMTESPPVAHAAVDEPIDVRLDTVGDIHPHMECKIVDPATGCTMDVGEPGEICVRGYGLMLGYWHDPDGTALKIDHDGWLHSGDTGTLDAQHKLRVLARIKDVIIKGGEKVYPREIEELLQGHPKVAEAQVVGVPDQFYGEEICLWLVLRTGQAASEDEIRRYCRERVSAFKIPRYVYFADSLPTTGSGKIKKGELRKRTMLRLTGES